MGSDAEPARDDDRPVASGAERSAHGTEPATALSYEQARDELVSVVKRLETGGLTLEQSIALWERGEELSATCAELLAGARARLATVLAQRPDADSDPDAPF